MEAGSSLEPPPSSSSSSYYYGRPPPVPAVRRCATQDLMLQDYSAAAAASPLLRRAAYEQRPPSHSPSTSSLFYPELQRGSWTLPELAAWRPTPPRPLCDELPPSPNYGRYSALLDDKHNWGFSTLRRRNSTTAAYRSQDRF